MSMMFSLIKEKNYISKQWW